MQIRNDIQERRESTARKKSLRSNQTKNAFIQTGTNPFSRESPKDERLMAYKEKKDVAVGWLINESPRHWAAKYALQKILLENDYSIIDDEFALETINTVVGERDYIIDLFAEDNKDCKRYAFELDGKVGHSTKRDLYKMRIRDGALLQIGIKTIRLKTNDLVGKKKQPVEVILQEIEYQKNRDSGPSNQSPLTASSTS
jgi:hypothetical protein